jgi:tetratricopeptide (TPR) repeat protein
MLCYRTRISVLILAVVTLAITGCAGDGATKVNEALEAEWAWLQESKKALDDMRAERADLILQLEESADSEEAVEPVEGEEDSAAEPAEPAEPVVTPEELEAKIYALSDEFGQRLVGFINDPANAPIVGEPLSERQLAALRLKSSEDIVLAQEYIEKGGDYRRAINIFEEALRVDPDNKDVLAAYEQAKADRWMSEERFAQAEKGMSDLEIRRLLGQPLPSNVRPYPEKQVVAWFYPTGEDRGAAGVYFNEDKSSGALKVYQTKYDAVAGKEEGEAE